MDAPDTPPSAPSGGRARTEHGTCVAIGESGVLIIGPSGAGKSSLALKLILDGPRCLPPAELVADDRVVLEAEGGVLVARPPPLLAGLIEVRGLGIRRLPHRPRVALAHLVELGPDAHAARMPNLEALRSTLQGFPLQRIGAASPEEAALLIAALLCSADYDN
ncbi:HPr kinase/phosphatase C-terminal domain-containing protein [Xanthobacter sp. KR7-225]|uniref:HPr kinase/phosphorylase n=1 Tax=Xanthobacter sp. KR7-225 TaxID=3156613 RepID=UPI0032B47263